MPRLTTQQKQEYKDVILGTVTEDYDGNELTTERKKVSFIFNRFHSEYQWNIDRIGEFKAMAEWLSGMALNIPCYNGDIMEMAERINKRTYTEREAYKILDNYWNFMGNLILQMFRKHRLG